MDLTEWYVDGVNQPAAMYYSRRKVEDNSVYVVCKSACVFWSKRGIVAAKDEHSHARNKITRVAEAAIDVTAVKFIR